MNSRQSFQTGHVTQAAGGRLTLGLLVSELARTGFGGAELNPDEKRAVPSRPGPWERELFPPGPGHGKEAGSTASFVQTVSSQ